MTRNLYYLTANYHLFDEEGVVEMGASDGVADQSAGSEFTEESWTTSKTNHKEFFDREVQGIVKKRIGDHKKLKADFDSLQKSYNERDEFFKLATERFGTEDLASLKQKLEDQIIERNAIDRDIDPDILRERRAQDRRIRETQMQNEQLQRQIEEQKASVEAQRKTAEWRAQADELKQEYPDFDLAQWVGNDLFKTMLQSGFSVKQAYEAADIENVKKMTSQTTEKRTADNIRAGQRVKENATGKTSTSTIKKRPSEMTADEIKEIERRVLNGETISF